GVVTVRELVSVAAVEVAAGIADEDNAVPGDGSRRHRLAMFRVRDGCFPHVLAGVEIVSKDPSVLGAAKQHAVRVGDAAVHWNNAGGIVLDRSPVFGACRRVQRERLGTGRPVRALLTMIRPDSKEVKSPVS